MAMRSVLSRGALTRSMQTTRGATRYFSDGKGRVRSEEERAADNVPLEKLKEEAEKQKAQKEKENAEKKPEGTHRG